MNILVTGGSGFIGTNLVSDLVGAGHHVLIYDKERSEAYPDQCIIADVRDREKLCDSMRGIDIVYHLAAEHRDDVRPVSLYYEVNLGGAKNIVHALKKNDVKKLIFTSTVALYGLNADEPNEDSPIRPFNDYGWSKYKSEIVLNEWAGTDNGRTLVIVRPTVIFGEKNRGNVYNLVSQIASGKFIMIGDGKNKKSMGYVLNFSQFLTLLPGTSPGIHIYNYADKPDLNMIELVNIVKNTLGRGNNHLFRLPYALGLLGGYAFDALSKITNRTFPISSIRIRKFCASTQIASEKLREIEFVPPYSLKDGLKRMILSEFKNEFEDRHP
jgi:nucleoside-diphosphate-sugar epimerase